MAVVCWLTEGWIVEAGLWFQYPEVLVVVDGMVVLTACLVVVDLGLMVMGWLDNVVIG